MNQNISITSNWTCKMGINWNGQCIMPEIDFLFSCFTTKIPEKIKPLNHEIIKSSHNKTHFALVIVLEVKQLITAFMAAVLGALPTIFSIDSEIVLDDVMSISTPNFMKFCNNF